MKQYKTINMHLTPLTSEVSQARIEDKCNDMASSGWNLFKLQIVDDCNVMLVFER